MAIGDNQDNIRARVYSHYATVTGGGVLVNYTTLMKEISTRDFTRTGRLDKGLLSWPRRLQRPAGPDAVPQIQGGLWVRGLVALGFEGFGLVSSFRFQG